jgi:hypothetical protein
MESGGALWARRRRFVGELLMALHGSALADSALREAALRALCACPAAPSYAADLAQHAGAFSAFSAWS